MKDKSDYKYVEGLLNGDSKIIQEIYEKFYGARKNWLLKNSGTAQDARDVFQDTMIVVHQMVQKKDFDLFGSFEGLLHGIFSRQWYKKIAKDKKMPQVDIEEPYHTIAEESQSGMLVMQLYRKHIASLNTDCQNIIGLRLLENLPHRKIAEQLNYTFDTARQKYARCFRKLLDLIKGDVEAKDLYE